MFPKPVELWIFQFFNWMWKEASSRGAKGFEKFLDDSCKSYEAINSSDLLFKAVEAQDIKCVNYAIQNGAKLDYNSNFLTPLKLSIKIGNFNISKILIEKGAPINDSTFNEGIDTPIWIAIKYKRIEEIKLLLEHDVNLKIKDYNNNSLLHICSANCFFWSSTEELVKLATLISDQFIKNNLNINMLNLDGKTPLDDISTCYYSQVKDSKIPLYNIFRSRGAKHANEL